MRLAFLLLIAPWFAVGQIKMFAPTAFANEIKCNMDGCVYMKHGVVEKQTWSYDG